jgi:hypothetical protein
LALILLRFWKITETAADSVDEAEARTVADRGEIGKEKEGAELDPRPFFSSGDVYYWTVTVTVVVEMSCWVRLSIAVTVKV